MWIVLLILMLHGVMFVKVIGMVLVLVNILINHSKGE